MNERVWYGVELTVDNAEVFKYYLRENGIKYEPSSCYNLIHFEAYMTNEERKAANNFLQEMVNNAL